MCSSDLKTLTGADIVVIPAGVPRKPGVRIVLRKLLKMLETDVTFADDEVSAKPWCLIDN